MINCTLLFLHPCDKSIEIFISGEMPHRVKKMVNRLERTSSANNNVSLIFRGQELSLNMLSLDMIKDTWLWDDEGFWTLGKTKLTEDHFYTNTYSRMRVHLAVQVLSESVGDSIDRYSNEGLLDEYAPLNEIVLVCDRIVDIWNANYSKRCECLDMPNDQLIKELHAILLLFVEWKNGCDSKNDFIRMHP